MRITAISARGLKGRDFTHQLAPATVFHGGNFKGKTRVMDAIRLGLLGYLPELGKTNKDTFKLASGPRMEVVLSFDDGTTVRRAWRAKGDSVSKEEDVPDWLKADAVMPVMLNAETYFALTDRARTDYVFNLCGGSAFTIDQILSRLNTAVCEMGDAGRKCVSELAAQVKTSDVQEYVAKLIELAAEAVKNAKASAVRSEKMIQELMRQRSQDVVSVPIAKLEADRAKLQRELADATERKGRMVGAYDQMQRDRSRRAAITDALKSEAAIEVQVKALRASVEELTVKVESPSLERVTQEDMDDTARRGSEAKTRLTVAINASRDAINRKQRTEKLLADLGEQTKCPYCGAAGDGWKALKEAEYRTTIEECVKEDCAQAQLAKAASDEREELSAHYLAQREKMQAQENDRARLTALRLELAGEEPKLSRFGDLRAELERLMTDDPQLTATVEALQTQINVLQQKIREVEQSLKAEAGRQFELKRMADAEKERDQSVIEQKAGEEVAKELREVQGMMVTGAFNSLLADANRLFGNVLMSPIAYSHENGQEIGSWRDGVWVSHRTMSGTEKALVYAAIQMALASRGTMRVMLLDELGRLDDVNVEKVMDAVIHAVGSGAINNFIGIDAGRGAYYEAEMTSGFTAIAVV